MMIAVKVWKSPPFTIALELCPLQDHYHQVSKCFGPCPRLSIYQRPPLNQTSITSQYFSLYNLFPVTKSNEEEEFLNLDTQQSRSPKRQSSTVYERVRTKLSRSFSFATCASLISSPSIVNESSITLNKLRSCSEKENLTPNDHGDGFLS